LSDESESKVYENISDVRTVNNIKYSTALDAGPGAVSFGVEMKTGTGRSYD